MHCCAQEPKPLLVNEIQPEQDPKAVRASELEAEPRKNGKQVDQSACNEARCMRAYDQHANDGPPDQAPITKQTNQKRKEIERPGTSSSMESAYVAK